MTWSPFFTEVTPAPTSSTTPAPSWPRIAGNSPSGSAPERVNSSVWQTPVALISTSTSPARGPSRSTVSTTSFSPARVASAAFVFIDPVLRIKHWPLSLGHGDRTFPYRQRGRLSRRRLATIVRPEFHRALGHL